MTIKKFHSLPTQQLAESLQSVLHVHLSALLRCFASPWNGHASYPKRAGRGCKAAKAATAPLLSRLTLRSDEHALHFVQPLILG